MPRGGGTVRGVDAVEVRHAREQGGERRRRFHDQDGERVAAPARLEIALAEMHRCPPRTNGSSGRARRSRIWPRLRGRQRSRLADIRDELGDLRTVVQQDLFTGARQEIEDLAANVLPDLQEGLRISAQSVNDFARSLSDIAQNTDFTATIQAIDPALDDAFDSAEGPRSGRFRWSRS